MAEMATAIIIVCLPSMRGYLRRGSLLSAFSIKKSHPSSGESGSRSYGPPTPLVTFGSSNKRPRVQLDEDSGSEIELNGMARQDVIYETKRVSVQFDPLEGPDSSRGRVP